MIPRIIFTVLKYEDRDYENSNSSAVCVQEKTWVLSVSHPNIFYKKPRKKAFHILQPKIGIIWHYDDNFIFKKVCCSIFK